MPRSDGGRADLPPEVTGQASLDSFGDGLTVAVIGASGGIGGALSTLLAENGRVRHLLLFSRSAPEDAPARASWAPLDLANDQSIIDAAGRVAETGPLDLLIIATGILHDGATVLPEKTWRTLDRETLLRVLECNTVGPALIGRHFLPLLTRERKSIFAALSARVGSISDNSAGGWHGYRASKAALNMILKNFAIELTHKNPQAICLGLHPGTVSTALSAPFQSNVPPEQLFSTDRSAGALLSVLDGVDHRHSGHVMAWDGKPVPP